MKKYAEYSRKLEDLGRCKKCRRARKKFAEKEKKGGKYCPFFGLFSNPPKLKPGIDVLIVLEGHGGGNTWEGIKNAEEQAEEMKSFYIEGKIDGERIGLTKKYQFPSFHCREINFLLKELSDKGYRWALTDFIHCYIEKDNKNEKQAMEYCANYLEKIIDDLKPKNIVLIGTKVQGWYKKYFKNKSAGHNIVKSYFPSTWSANYWARQGGHEYILSQIKKART